MKKIQKLAVAIVAVAVAGCCTQDAERSKPLALRVGTCNVRCPNRGDDKAGNGWEARKTDLMGLLRKLDMDVFGMQEVHEKPYADICAGLKEWAFVDDYEVTTPVAYRRSRFAFVPGSIYIPCLKGLTICRGYFGLLAGTGLAPVITPRAREGDTSTCHI